MVMMGSRQIGPRTVGPWCPTVHCLGAGPVCLEPDDAPVEIQATLIFTKPIDIFTQPSARGPQQLLQITTTVLHDQCNSGHTLGTLRDHSGNTHFTCRAHSHLQTCYRNFRIGGYYH